MPPNTDAEGTPALVATCQQSRFHTEAGDSTSISSKDASSLQPIFLSSFALYLPLPHQLDIRNLTLTLGNREILSGADLKLQYGIHYVVVGRNGVGKSSCVCLLPLSSCLI